MLPDFRVRQRDFLLQISRAITAQLDLTEVLRRVLQASVAMMAGQVGLIALRASDEHFYVRATLGLDGEQIPELNQQLHEIISGLGQEDGPDVLNEKLRAMAHSIDSGLRQAIALPLAFANEPLGLLIVFRSYRNNVSGDDLQVLQSFADQAAIAVHNAQLYDKINQERMRLAAILDYSADGVMILDADLTILRFNQALERMTGWPQNDALHQAHDAVIRWDRLEDGDLQDAIDAGWPFKAKDSVVVGETSPERNTLYVEGDLITHRGQTLSVAITYAPMLTPDGQIANIIANVRDITNFRLAQEMQNVFISGISHELKTPVAIIKGYAATLQREDATWDRHVIVDTLSVIEDEADRLTDLIQNLLTASKLQAQRELTLNLSDVSLDHLVHRTLERFSNQTKSHEFLYEFPDDFPIIQADETRLRQVLDNLIGNAIKYSPEGGKIIVTGAADDRNVTVSVTDSGVGISKRDQERVFDRFFRVDGKLSRRTQGTGLGLYLAKAIVEAHHGAVGVDSVPDEGSTFYFTIPQRQ